MSGAARRMAGRDTGLSSNVVKADASRHLLGKAGVKGADMRMDVSKKGESRPSANFHYQGVGDALEFEGHSTRRS